MTLPNLYRRLFALALFAFLSACHDAASNAPAQTAAEAISTGPARIRSVAPGQTVSGAFMTLKNTSSTLYALTGADTDIANMVEMHETLQQGDIMQMRQVKSIDIPANGSVELKPGSFHIMLMGLKRTPATGETIPLTLTFSDHSQKTVEATVTDISE